MKEQNLQARGTEAKRPKTNRHRIIRLIRLLKTLTSATWNMENTFRWARTYTNIYGKTSRHHDDILD